MNRKCITLATALLFAVACSDSNKGEPQVVNEGWNANNNADSMPADRTSAYADEMEQYRLRLSTRVSELDSDIENAKREREAEKNKKKLKEYDDRISEREERRSKFREKLDALGAQTKEGWNNFKTEVDEMFTRDTSDKR